ncbi:hypothetical protein BaRGS_00034586 [Batillaria attramentaria]|uniref:Receptor ligand binding region domain-containing protein n=1 Tax=Batillaria attramentaria TaxID=370345 RepID=A0ABD0JH38_9CAEN
MIPHAGTSIPWSSLKLCCFSRRRAVRANRKMEGDVLWVQSCLVLIVCALMTGTIDANFTQIGPEANMTGVETSLDTPASAQIPREVRSIGGENHTSDELMDETSTSDDPARDAVISGVTGAPSLSESGTTDINELHESKTTERSSYEEKVEEEAEEFDMTNMEDIVTYVAPKAQIPPAKSTSLCVDDNSNHTQVPINAVYLLAKDPRYLFSEARMMPAVDVAIRHVRRHLLPDVTFTVLFNDTRCNSKNAPLALFDYYRSRPIHVVFGPICDYSLAPVARYAPYWNLPVITSGGFAHDFSKLTPPYEEYQTLTRVGPHFNSMADYVVSPDSQLRLAKTHVDIRPGGNELRHGQVLFSGSFRHHLHE